MKKLGVMFVFSISHDRRQRAHRERREKDVRRDRGRRGQGRSMPLAVRGQAGRRGGVVAWKNHGQYVNA